MSDVSAQDEWISRVLGITPGSDLHSDISAFEDDIIGEAPVDQARSRLDDIDGILKAVDEAIELANGFKDLGGYDVLRTKVDGRGGWAQRRAALDKTTVGASADLADFTAVHKAIDDAAILLKDINKGLQGAHLFGEFAAGLTAEQTPASRLSAGQRCVDTMPKGPDKVALQQLLDSADSKKGDGTTPDAGFDKEIDAFWQQAGVKASDAVRSELRKSLAIYKGFADTVSKLNPVNPANAVFQALSDRTLEADQFDAAKAQQRLELWSATLRDTKAALAGVKTPRTERQAAESTLYRINGKLATLPARHTGRPEIVNGVEAVKNGLISGCAKPTVEELGKEWTKRHQEADALEKKLDGLLLTLGGGASLLKSVEAFRAAMEKLKLSPPTVGTPAAATYDNLLKDLAYLEKAQGSEKQLVVDGTNKELVDWLRANIARDLRDASKIRFQGMDEAEIDQEMTAQPQADNPTDQAIWEAAFAARFGTELKVPDGMRASRLPELYALFKIVPADHASNPSIKAVEYELDDKPPQYSFTDKKIVLANLKGPGAKTQGGRYAHPGAKPDTGEDIDYFTAAALHEIGHARDDDKKLMDKNTSDDVGGWNTETLASVAAAYAPDLASQFNAAPADELHKLLSQVLLTGACVKPLSAGAPFGKLLGDWDRIYAAAIKYEQQLRGKSPWNKPLTAPDKRNYHEAYPASWVSYSAARREAQLVLCIRTNFYSTVLLYARFCG